MRRFGPRRPLGYQALKDFVLGKPEASPEPPPPPLDGSDLPQPRPDGVALLRERTSLLWFPFVHVYNKLRYTVVAKLVGAVVCVALLTCGTWLAVMKSRIVRQEQWFAGRNNLVVAVIGKDDVEGLGRSDTLLLVNFRYHDRKVKVLSVPRDTRAAVHRPGPQGTVEVRFSKINHALRWGGVALTLETLQRYLGVRIDNHLVVNYGLFVEMVDFVGGIPLEVEKRMYYVDRAGGLTIDLQPGFQILDGNRALQYVRFRHDGAGDIGRMGRQQKFLKCAAAHVLQPEVFMRLVKSVPALLKHIATDVPIDLALLCLYRFRDIDVKELEMKTLPGREMSLPVEPGSSQVLSYYVSSFSEVQQTLDGWFLNVADGVRATPDPDAFEGLEALEVLAQDPIAAALAGAGSAAPASSFSSSPPPLSPRSTFPVPAPTLRPR